MNYLKLVFQILFVICCITKIFAEETEEIEENDEIEKSTNSPNTFHLVKKFMNLDLNKDNELTFSEIKLAFKDGIEDLKIDNFFKVFDSNKDGVISLSEYVNLKKQK